MSLAGMTVGVVISAIDRASAPIQQIQGATSRLGQALERISTKAALAGAALHGMALATSGLSARMQQVGMQAVHAFAAFDDARAVIASMPGVTKESLDRMQAAAFAFTRQNKATLTDYYNTAYNILSAGIPEALATYATEVAIKVGQATRGSADEAGEAVAILFNNMRDGSREASGEFARMGDIITATQQRFQLRNLSQLTEGLKYATPAAKTAKLAVADMAAAVGRLNSAGLQGSMAGTALANLLANRFKAAQEIGFKVAIKKGTGELDLARTLDNLKARIGDINRLTPEMEDKLRKGFGEEGFRAVMLLLAQTETLKDDLAAIRDSAGSFERASRIINDAAGAKWQQMVNRIQQTWIRLGEVLMPVKDAIAAVVLRVVDAIDGLIARFPKVTAAAVAGLAGLSAALAALGTALIAVGALGKLRGGKAAITGQPAGAGGLIGGAVDAVAGGVQKVWVVNMPGGGLVGGLPDIGGKGGGAAGKAGAAARTMGARLRSLVAGVAMQAGLAWQSIVSGAGAAARAIALVGRALLLNPIGLTLTAIAAAAYLIWRHWDAIGPRLAAVWQTVKDAFAAAWQWIGTLPARMQEAGRALLDGLIGGMRERWQALKDGVSGIASGIADAVRGVLGIRSPSRVFAEIGGHLMDGLEQGIVRAAGQPLAAMHGVASALAAPMAVGAVVASAQAMPAVAAPAPQVIAPAALAVPAPQPAGGNSPVMPAAPIQITVNLNGPASPEAAQDVAAAVRREVQRALAEAARRDALGRRAALIDGGLA
ncbi:phage tail tape measure protein [Pseudothauera hydrothermalis]|uniref:phage tail tape measure protein n=1 Tax=Pseudothauera hydrothermalis TaxID=2184083 RepID=UPI000E0966E2|nr:phage tail tape measure protein [Pseudothauera hydrothermalis]